MDRELNNLHIFVGWPSRPSHKNNKNCKLFNSHSYAITSDGTKHGNPQYYRKYEKKLAKRQKQLSHKLKGSGNRNKARIKVAKVYAKIVRCREDFLHKLSRKLVDENFRHSCRKSSS